MPGTITASDDANLPAFMRLALGEDRSWVAEGLCTRLNNTSMFLVNETDHIYADGKRRGKILVHGEDRVLHAEMICRSCPVQWDCARYGLRTGAVVGTWGVRISRLFRINEDKINDAEAAGVALDDIAPRLPSAKKDA